VEFAARFPGYVEKVWVDVGDKVKKGQPLLNMDSTEISSLITSLNAEKEEILRKKAALFANLDYAKRNFMRYKKLMDEKASTRDEFEQARAKYQSLSAQVKALDASLERVEAGAKDTKNRLSYLEIVSPDDGFITERSVDNGTYVSPGSPLISLELEKGVWFEARVDEEMIHKVAAGDEVTIEIPATGKIFKEKIASFSRKADPYTHSFTVRADMGEKSVPPGLFGRLYIKKGVRQAVLLPESAIMDKGGLTGVYVVDKDQTAHWRVIRKGRCWRFHKENKCFFLTDDEKGAYWEIISGVSAGERVAVSNLHMMREGTRVE
jgi:RND family efflux transporter MFP subunit